MVAFPSCDASETSSSVVERIECILVYNCESPSCLDVSLNYTLVALNIAASIQVLRAKIGDDSDVQSATVRRMISISFASLVCVAMFQVALCLAVGCVGVSIVWAALGGWMLREEKKRRRVSRRGQNVSTSSCPGVAEEDPERGFCGVGVVVGLVLVVDAAAILYYAVVEEPITTVAHVLAFLLGYAISFENDWFLEMACCLRNREESNDEATRPLKGENVQGLRNG